MDDKEVNAKQRIADAFKRHFTHFGFKKTSVDEVSRELKISKKTIYQFFSSKEKIFYYIVSRVAGKIRSDMEKDLRNYNTEKEKLQRLVEQIFSKSKQWLKTNDAFEFKYKYEIGSLAFKDAFQELLIKIITSGMEKGEFSEAPVDRKTRFIQGIISEGMDLLAQDPDQDVVEDVIDSIIKILE